MRIFNRHGRSVGYWPTSGAGGKAGKVANTSSNWRHPLPFSTTLFSMAQKVVHDRVKIEHKVPRGGGGRGKVKLTDEQCAEIRRRFAAGADLQSLSKDYGVGSLNYLKKVAIGELRYNPPRARR